MIWAVFSYLNLGGNSAGSVGVRWFLSCGKNLGEQIYDAQALDKFLTPRKSMHSFLLFVFQNILGLHGVILHVLHLRKETHELQQS